MDNQIISPEKMYLVTDIPGYTPNISRLICMMHYVRDVTLYSVKGLTVKELDHLHDAKSNSIGALLLHIASTEFFFQKVSFEGRELNEEEEREWEPSAKLGDLGREKIIGNDLDYYLNKLSKIRSRTLELFKEKNDVWLEEQFPYYKDFKANHYHVWFHVFEDEINHRGQISWLRKRLMD